MNSKNKPAQSADEAAYVAIVATLPCACCQAPAGEVHEFEQGQWFTSCNLCIDCHRGGGGWHGTRSRWYLHKMTMLDAIESTVRQVFSIVTERQPRKSSVRHKVVQEKVTKLGRPHKIYPRPQ